MKTFRYKGYEIEIHFHNNTEQDIINTPGFGFVFYDAELCSTESNSYFATEKAAAKAAMEAVDADIIEQEIASGEYI